METNLRVIEVLTPIEATWATAAEYAVAEVLKSTEGVTDIWVSGMKNVVDPSGTVRYRIAADVSCVCDPT